MHVSSPCQQCIKAIYRTPRIYSFHCGNYFAISGHSNQIASSSKNTSRFQITKRHFTLPDLSKLSPFASSSKSSNKKNPDFSDFTTYHESVVMPFKRNSLFEIVSNVEEYDKFVPYCVGSKIDSASIKKIDEDTKEYLADLAIGYGQVRESYTSKVTIVKGKSVQATAIPTPLFNKLETKWTFKDDVKSNSTKVDFEVHYSFSNPFYAAFASRAIEKMTTKMIESFTQRAQQIERSQHFQQK